MHIAAIADSATRLGRIPPCAETVLALAEAVAGRASTSFPSILLRDPGALLGFLRFSPVGQREPPGTIFPAREDAAEHAARLLQQLTQDEAGGLADWSRPGAATVYRFSRTAAGTAQRLAEACQVSPEAAAVAGLLSILGPLAWYARERTTSRSDGAPDSAALTRHLARRLEHPEWLAKVLLSLDLSAELGTALGADRRLLLVVQASAGLARERVRGVNGTASALAVRLGHAPAEALHELEIAPPDAHAWADAAWEASEPPPCIGAAGLLWRAIRLAQPSQGPEDRGSVELLEAETEKLRQLLGWLHETEEVRLREAKLRGLAELAAGAAHEVNTPLAVISGQAQYLLRSEENVERAAALQRIVAQAHRVHEMFRDLMLFARPPASKRKQIRLDRLVRKVVDQLTAPALARNVTVELPRCAALRCYGDVGLLGVAIGCLIRNALEAAPAGGWVRVRLEKADRAAAVIVEDNGPGLTTAQREHLFDPFYSGRSAGRGLGLGLPKAWRVAHLHGGEIAFDCTPNQPTRFTLTVPVSAAAPGRSRKRARVSKRGRGR